MNEQDRETIRRAMSLIGSAKSERKTAACRLNGKLGGRPRKNRVAHAIQKTN